MVEKLWSIYMILIACVTSLLISVTISIAQQYRRHP